MKFGPVAIADAVGAILAHATNAGDKRFRKAHLLSAADVADLQTAGVTEVIAAVLDAAAARGDKKALKTFFGFGGDGAAEEEHIGVTSVVIHLIGDDAFARFLREQPREFRKDLIIGWELGIVYPFDTGEYFRQHFPKSAKLLFPGE